MKTRPRNSSERNCIGDHSIASEHPYKIKRHLRTCSPIGSVEQKKKQTKQFSIMKEKDAIVLSILTAR